MPEVESWNDALLELGIVAWHTTDRLRNRFGGAPSHVPMSLLNLLGRIAIGECRIVTIAVHIEAHAALRVTYPTIQPLTHLCVGFCWHNLGIAEQDDGKTGTMRLLFDRGEPFLQRLKAPWQRFRRQARHDGGWPAQFKEISSAAAKDHPGLQVADLIAWGVRQHHETRQANVNAGEIVMTTLLTGKHYHAFMDADALHRLYVKRETITSALHYELTP